MIASLAERGTYMAPRRVPPALEQYNDKECKLYMYNMVMLAIRISQLAELSLFSSVSPPPSLRLTASSYFRHGS